MAVWVLSQQGGAGSTRRTRLLLCLTTILQQRLPHLPALVVLAGALAASTPASFARPPHPFQLHSGAVAEPVAATPQEAPAAAAPPVAATPSQAPAPPPLTPPQAPASALAPPTQVRATAPATPTRAPALRLATPTRAPASPTATQPSRFLSAPAQLSGAMTPPPG